MRSGVNMHHKRKKASLAGPANCVLTVTLSKPPSNYREFCLRFGAQFFAKSNRIELSKAAYFKHILRTPCARCGIRLHCAQLPAACLVSVFKTEMQKTQSEFTRHPTLAQRMGLDSRTLTAAIARGELPGVTPVRIGKSILYRSAAVEAFLTGATAQQGGAA